MDGMVMTDGAVTGGGEVGLGRVWGWYRVKDDDDGNGNEMI